MSITVIHLPSLGKGIHEGTFKGWLKELGEKVQKDEPLFEISTDKVDSEVPSPATGYLRKTLVSEGDEVSVDSVVAYLSSQPDSPLASFLSEVNARNTQDSAQDLLDNTSHHVTSHAPSLSSSSSPSSLSHRVVISPYAKKRALELHVSLPEMVVKRQPKSSLQRITASEVEAYYLRSRKQDNAALGSETDRTSCKGKLYNDRDEYLEGVKVRRQPLSSMRRIIARRMSASLRESPHVSTSVNVDMTSLLTYKNQTAHNLSISACLMKASACAIMEYPFFNACIEGHDILWRDDIHIGCAVAIEHGIIVPVVQHVDKKDIFVISKELAEYAHLARLGKLAASHLKGATFTLSNPGMFGCEQSTAIIHQPQVAILCVGRIQTHYEPVFAESNVEDLFDNHIIDMQHVSGLKRSYVTTLTLSFDHRLLDGKDAGDFLRCIEKQLKTYTVNSL
ncbi:MAG: dihydrolipoamide acetyltransferase family protein [Proteobacteria bacterium]|nr:dihydrolipoamide acetyltransferase family protein [Pseudomonadota bacterium]